MRIGIAGVGRMGAAIGQRLIDVGHEVVVWNRSPEKAEPLQRAGATLAQSPRDLAGRVEIIITILTNSDALAAFTRGRPGCWLLISRTNSSSR